MIKAIKQWIAKAAYEGSGQMKEEAVVMRSNRLSDMFSDSGAALIVFQIDNGYVVRSYNRSAEPMGSRPGGFHYCADHQAIADHIVANAMRDKLGVQQEMFPDRKQVKVIPKSQTAGLVGAQQAVPF